LDAIRIFRVVDLHTIVIERLALDSGHDSGDACPIAHVVGCPDWDVVQLRLPPS